MAGRGRTVAANRFIASILAIIAFGCVPPDYLGDAQRLFNSHRNELQRVTEIISRHPEIERYQGGGTLIPDRDARGPLSAVSYKDYKEVSEILKASGVELAQALFKDSFSNRRHFTVDFLVYCTGWHRGSECTDVVYDEEEDMSRSTMADEKCVALTAPHWYACDQR